MTSLATLSRRAIAAALFLAAPLAPTYSQAITEGQPGTFVLTDCRIETVTNGTIENGRVVISEGRIQAAGPDAAVPAGATTISCDGGTVYPGFIEGGSKLGLTEIGSLNETRDFREVGAITPHMQAITAVNPASTHLPIARVNGVTTALASPAGGLMPGTAALISLHGHTPAQMDLGFRGVVVDFPCAPRRIATARHASSARSSTRPSTRPSSSRASRTRSRSQA
jgi:hypothetical protein